MNFIIFISFFSICESFEEKSLKVILEFNNSSFFGETLYKNQTIAPKINSSLTLLIKSLIFYFFQSKFLKFNIQNNINYSFN